MDNVTTYEDLIESDVPPFGSGYFDRVMKNRAAIRRTAKVKKTKVSRDKEFKLLFDVAMKQGKIAASKHTPTPMIVGEPSTLFGTDVDMSSDRGNMSSGLHPAPLHK